MIKKIIRYIKRKIENIFKIKIEKIKTSEKYNKSFVLAINQLSKFKSNSIYNDGLTCVIFSKDRALQLYALLESIKLRSNIRGKIYIIYKTSNLKHEKSYNDLIIETKDFNFKIEWIIETKDFKNTLLSVLQNIKTKKMFFLTDDDIFINNFDLNDCKIFSDNNLIFSLRLSKNISHSYNLQKKIKAPHLKKLDYRNYYKFKWFETDGEWNYPWSVNGHIYLLSDIIILTSISDFNAPNSYEAALQDFNFYGKKKLGICSEKSFLINLPVNITQSEIKNKSGSIKLDDYLKAWENKKKLNIEVLENYNPYSVHEEHILLLIDR